MSGRTTGRGWGSRWTRGLAAVGALAVALSGALVPLAGPASAADNGSWSVFPSSTVEGSPTKREFFVVETKEGQVVNDAVTIANATDGVLTLELYARDAINTASGGGFAPLDPEKENTDVGAWITLSKDRVVLEPNTQESVPFTLSVPAGATPGDHAGVILARNPAPASPETGGPSQILIQQAVGSRVYVRVQGPLNPALLVSDVTMQPVGGTAGLTTKQMVITYKVTNEGNLRLIPESSLQVEGLFGRDLFQAEKPLPELLPGNSTTIQEVWDSPPLFDRAVATVTVTTPDGVETSADTAKWIIPWLLVLALVLALAAIGFWRWWKRRQEQPDEEAVASGAPRGRHAPVNG